MGLLSDSDVGKKVFDGNGNLLGEITSVGDDGALFRSDPGADPDVLSPLSADGEEEYHLPSEQVDRVNAEGIYTRPL